MPPISSPPPARPGPPCTSAGSGEPCPVGLLRVLGVQHQQPPVPRCDTEHHRAREPGSPVTTDPARLPWPAPPARSPGPTDVYGSSVATGPNASTSCGSARSGSSARSSTGDRNAPRAASAPITSTCSGSPDTMVPAPSSALSDRRTSSRCSRLASAPIRTSGLAGLPTVTFASRSRAAAVTASISGAGTNARRIAVHFCPALTVISVTSCLTYRSNSGVPRPRPGRGWSS